MNIAKKSLEELIDTEIGRLRHEVKIENDRAQDRMLETINERAADLKAAIAAAPKLEALIADAEFLAVVDKEGIFGTFDAGVELEIHGPGHVRFMMSASKNDYSYNTRRRRYRFVVAAIALDDKETNQ